MSRRGEYIQNDNVRPHGRFFCFDSGAARRARYQLAIYLAGNSIGSIRNGYPLLLASGTQARHLAYRNGAVYWTDGRSVLKALTCVD